MRKSRSRLCLAEIVWCSPPVSHFSNCSGENSASSTQNEKATSSPRYPTTPRIRSGSSEDGFRWEGRVGRGQGRVGGSLRGWVRTLSGRAM
ncbi:hypothetical protein M433DRAFT_274554 [Acidomyces richmondensis BFW]|nr:MAG: hypothetical protein FE78DRAFT_428769 [Acidomyces sp. 'richmondensis']KYG45018.1 hypothetical protein M433DRAFT_274554 [Acidomyces richmondensis BFW]